MRESPYLDELQEGQLIHALAMLPLVTYPIPDLLKLRP